MSKRYWLMSISAGALCGLLFGPTLCCGQKTQTTTTLTISNSTPNWFNEVTLTSTTTPGPPVSGTVKIFEDNGVLLYSTQLNSQDNGTVTWQQKFLGGAHKVYSVFDGNGNYTSSTSVKVAMAVTPSLAAPTSGAFLGVIPGPTNDEVNIEALEASQAAGGIGRQFPLHVQYRIGPVISSQEIDAGGTWHPDPNLQGDIDNGRVPVLSWPCDQMIYDSDSYIANGNEDTNYANIKGIADALRQYPGPVLLRWSWELNDFDHKNCHGDLNVGSASGWQPTDFSNFQAAWQHIWEVFQQEQATNVTFLWNLANYDQGQLNAPYDSSGDNFYPGDTFVDWVGLDSYQRNPASTYSCNIQCPYNDFTTGKFGSNLKPFIQGENGSAQYSECSEELQENYLGGSQDSVQADFGSSTYPQLKAYDYWDSGGTFPLDSNGGFSTFTSLAASSEFSARIADGVISGPFSISFSNQTVSGTPGQNLTTSVTVTPASWFNGSVDLSAGGLYPGMAAAFSKTHLSFASSQNPQSVNLTLTTSSNTPPTPPIPSGLNLPSTLGMSMITVTGTSGAGQQASNGLIMNLTGPTFTISDNPGNNSSLPLSATNGWSTTTTVTVSAVDGYTGTVNLQAADLGAGSGTINGYQGVTATFSPASVTIPQHCSGTACTPTSTLTLTATASTLPAVYQIVISGTDSINPNLTQYIFQGAYNAPSYALYVNKTAAVTGHFNCQASACPDTCN